MSYDSVRMPSNWWLLWPVMTASGNLSTSGISAEDGRLVGEGGEDRRQFSKAVGLFQDGVELVGTILSHDGVVRVAARGDEARRRALGAEGYNRLFATYAAGNRQVHEDDAERMADCTGLCIRTKCAGPVRDSLRLISEFLQHRDRYLSHREFVVHDQDTAMAAELGRCLTRLSGGTGTGSRQEDREGRAGTRCRGSTDVSVMLVDDGIGCRQAKAAAATLRTEERIEDSAKVRLGDPYTGVAEVDADIVAWSQVRVRAVVYGDVACNDGNRSSGRHRLVSVDDNIGEDLRQLSFVDACPPQIRGQVETSRNIRIAQGEGDSFLQDVRKVLDRTDGSPSLGEGQQLLRQPAGLEDLPLGFLEEFVGGVRVILDACEVDVADDAGQHVVEVMSDASCKDAQRLQLFHPLKLVFETEPLGDVADAGQNDCPTLQREHACADFYGEVMTVAGLQLSSEAGLSVLPQLAPRGLGHLGRCIDGDVGDGHVPQFLACIAYPLAGDVVSLED